MRRQGGLVQRWLRALTLLVLFSTPAFADGHGLGLAEHPPKVFTMQFSPILDLPALEQARLVARRELSSEELVRIYLERIEVLDPQVKAFVETWPKQALATARQKDAMVKAGGPLPAFHGIPMGVKDMYFVRGRFTRFGSRSTPIWSPIDCITTRALRRGKRSKNNSPRMPEMAAAAV